MKLFSLVLPYISAHSWIACTDYAEKNAAHYDHGKCRGWPRLASRFAPIGAQFGGDTGYDTRPGSTSSPCATRRSADDYASGHHSAVYFSGQQVVLAHPMKNHGTGSCTNKYIPDHGNWLYAQPMTAVGGDDPTLDTFKQNEIVDLSTSPFGHNVPDSEINSYPKPGYQNAPAFCEDTDKALGTYSFNVPRDMAPGHYTFAWLWAFNGPTDYYSTCFEVEIVENAAKRAEVFTSRGQSDFTLPCDQSATSNGAAGSLEGCSLPPPTSPPTTQSSTALPPSSSTSEPETNGNMGYILSNQITGKIVLPVATSSVSQREIHVTFASDCASSALPNFWYARLSHTHDSSGRTLQRFRRHSDGAGEQIHYVLLQESQDDISRGFVGFHFAFDGGCRILDNPTEVHVFDTV